MKITIFIIFFLTSYSLFAQKEDYIMFTGYDSEYFSQGWGNLIYNFNQAPVSIQFKNLNYTDFHFAFSSVSTSEGRLLFYTDGIQVLDSTYTQMLHGDSINIGSPLGQVNNGYSYPNGVLIVPRPNTSQYYLFQNFVGQLPNPDNRRYANLKVSTIDMRLNNGLGKVIEKNKVLDTTWLSSSFLSSTRHANGRDWWVMTRNNTKNEYYTYLISPDGVSPKQVQSIGQPYAYDFRGRTHQSNFSPDGSKVVSGDWVEGIAVWDFDRCTGLVSNKRTIPVDTFASGRIGVCFSPNSRYIYHTKTNYIIQIDTEASDIVASVDTVAFYDGFVWMNGITPNSTRFFLPYNTPDGRIFISAGGGSNRYLHTIENPNEQGIACNVQQHSIFLPTWNNGTTPNFPTYRLGALVGSGCDTISPTPTLPRGEGDAQIRVFPNPAHNELNIQCADFNNKQTIITDMLGRAQKSLSLQSENTIVNLSNFPNGIYYVSIYENNRLLGSRKLVVLHE